MDSREFSVVIHSFLRMKLEMSGLLTPRERHEELKASESKPTPMKQDLMVKAMSRMYFKKLGKNDSSGDTLSFSEFQTVFLKMVNGEM